MKTLTRFLIRNLPRKYLIRFSFLFSNIFFVFFIGNKVQCPVCNGRFRKFLSYGIKSRKNALCPKCLSLERHRLLWLFLKNKTGFFEKNIKLLHIAPEQCFYKKFKKLMNIHYITADLESPLASVKMDIQDIPYEDNLFDVVICNHVMEHIPDDLKAMSEIHRILKQDGFAILQVPIDKNREKTYEDTTITAPLEREKHFRQKDHLRLYGLDYPQRLQHAGFKVIEQDYNKEIAQNIIEKYKLPKNEIIYLCRK